MAYDIIGGIVTSTVLTLVIVPIAYTWIYAFTHRKEKEPYHARQSWLAGPWALTFFVQPGDTALMELSLTALSIFVLSYLVKWVDICVSSYFTALEQPAVSLALSLLGTLVAPLAALAVLVPCLGLTGVWWMPFCAGVISAAVSLACLRRLVF